MSLGRREFIRLLGLAGAAGMVPGVAHGTLAGPRPDQLYELPVYGNVTLLHITDTHAQLNPVYFREPGVNLGVGESMGKAPHLVGERLLSHFGIVPHTAEAHAFTCLDFTAAAAVWGKVGGFAHLRTLVQRLRARRAAGSTLLLDGGDTWQGSGTALWTRGQDMVGACNLLGVDVMTGHWEFTYRDEEVLRNVKAFRGEFLAHNVRVREEAAFDYRFAGFAGFNEQTGNAFRPYTLREAGGVRVAIIGQAFPYTPIANPQRFMPDWSFGIQESELQRLVDRIRTQEKPEVVVLLSHNGMDVDLKLAQQVSGIDVILGGHTHDGVPAPSMVKNRGGYTLVTNAGSNGKFVGVMDLEVRGGGLRGWRYRLLPVFSNLLPADPEMARYIEQVRAPYAAQLAEPLALAGELLYRRGNFNGTFDQIICDAQRRVGDAQIALSPGFRWGTSVLPGQPVTMEHVLDQTCITYPETYVREMSGEELKAILEDVADNLFNRDPYYQQGGDMVRTGGMDYICDPTAGAGQRISGMTLDDGTPVEARRRYKVAGWATVNAQAPGRPIWEIVAEYLRAEKEVTLRRVNTPKLKNVAGNPGLMT